uniref:Carboxypeptidase n=1 Tax=Rhabditophanes sp. KR3021 TaxID=114890 RepID=A0AC35TKP0_9BILA
MIFRLLLAFGLLSNVALADKAADEITSLPGLTYRTNFKQYSGYLSTTSNTNLHYWLVESQGNPLTDPLVLWLNGGVRPFHPNSDGQTLFENVFSWNKIANVLYLESPRSVGFSYGPANDGYFYGDNQTAVDNADALGSFLAKFPEYAGRDFYATGESYGGVYLPTLTEKLIPLVQSKALNLNFKGVAIGNGILSVKQQLNSYINLNYIRGAIEYSQYQALSACCPANAPLYQCNFFKYLNVDNRGQLHPNKYPNDPVSQQCASSIWEYGYHYLWFFDPAGKPFSSRSDGVFLNDAYNNYLVCYNELQPTAAKPKMSQKTMVNRYLLHNTQRNYDASPISYGSSNPFVDQFSLINTQSTDNQQGFPCFAPAAATSYLNRPEVMTALHVDPKNTKDGSWTECVDDNLPYHFQNYDTTPIFERIMATNYPLNFLFYNGDVDSVCNFLGDQWFLQELADNHKFNVTTPYQSYNYTQAAQFLPKVGGFVKQYSTKNYNFDLVTVKGSGHYVPRDRPGPALQMIANFIKRTPYTTPLQFSIAITPLYSKYNKTSAKPISRKEADKVTYLPGATFDVTFDHYSGYLNAIKGNYIYYWLTESKYDKNNAPLVIWLNGGPGCSSTSGAMGELGPFHPNADGKTLFENVYSWNTHANLLVIDSPRNVGFSWQNMTENPDTTYDDDKTSQDLYLALKDFISVHPEYINRPLYLAGESYGGKYIPNLAWLLIQRIQDGSSPEINLQGFSVGNGELSDSKSIGSTIANLYFHGIHDVDDWKGLRNCCPNSTFQELAFCDFSQFITADKDGNPIAKIPGDKCGNSVAKLAFWNWENSQVMDVYNMYSDCYQEKSFVFGTKKGRTHKKHIKENIMKRIVNYTVPNQFQKSLNPYFNDYSTDSSGGFPCDNAQTNYFNTKDVRDALHIPSYIPLWAECNDFINENYNSLYSEMAPVFQHMIDSKYPLKIIVYNGDVDTACDQLQDQWVVEELATANNFTVTVKRDAWWFQQQIAGYWKQFKGGNIVLDLVTVKGAGHMVPTDRSGPALQMFSNFMQQNNYSTPIIYNLQKHRLKPQYSIEQLITSATNPKIRKHRAVKQLKALLKITDEYVPKPLNSDKVCANVPPHLWDKEGDLVTNLPGLTFVPPFKSYSGYVSAKSEGDTTLNAQDKIFYHYWLTEHYTSPATAPLILWLNGGPGCSSLGGLFTELGPFRSSHDAQKLYENPFAWNKVGNVLFLEAPRGVGFSYSIDGNMATPYNDTTTALHSVAALISFFTKFPEYKNRPFYLSGESYGGVYIPTLTDALIKRIQADNLNYINLKGVAIGNGELAETYQINSVIDLMYYKGLIGYDDFKAVSACCPDPHMNSTTMCDFTQYIYLDVYGNANPKPSNDPAFQKCANLVVNIGFNLVWATANDVYNTYQDCYVPTSQNPYTYAESDDQTTRNMKNRASSGLFGYSKVQTPNVNAIDLDPLRNTYNFVDQNTLINGVGTDGLSGFSCVEDSTDYLRRPDVMAALHVCDQIVWQDCNDTMNSQYVQQHNDTTSVFQSIIASGYPLSFLIYNGDADMACEFLGDQWFIENLIQVTQGIPIGPRAPWFYAIPGFVQRIAGFQKSFTIGTHITIDQLTVKGAGHFAPMDRAGPALQMLTNYIGNAGNYSKSIPKAVLTPMNAAEIPVPPSISRADADKVPFVPGATWQPNFDTYSGYLNSGPNHYLHYMFISSQNDPVNDPVVTWFNGGPGCSSLIAQFSELGAFYPNPDGKTLFENVYSWNKFANVLFIESPYGVGYSYSTSTHDVPHDDNNVATENANAIDDFFKNVFPNLKKNPFILSGESYGGVYIPTLTLELLNRKYGGNNMPVSMDYLNFQGFSIGNGEVSEFFDAQTAPDILYFRGFLGKQEYDLLQTCCPMAELAQGLCRYQNLVKYDDNGNITPKNPYDKKSVQCMNMIQDIAMTRKWTVVNDVYNMFENCYEQTTYNFGSESSKEEKSAHLSKAKESIINKMRKSRFSIKNAFISQVSNINYASTDSQGAFQCYSSNGIQSYLNQVHVRDAFHIPDYVQDFLTCADDSFQYNVLAEYYSMTETFKKIMAFNHPMRALMYTGSVDNACPEMESSAFLEDLVKSVGAGAKVTHPRDNWTYQLNSQFYSTLAGYQKKWQLTPTFTLDFLTIKGSGHFITDRPQQSTQMIKNFIMNTGNYSLPSNIDTTRKQLLSQYQPRPQVANPTDAPTPPVPVITGSSPKNQAFTTLAPRTTTSGSAVTYSFIIFIITFMASIRLF